jgi:hypothetical protein
MPVAYKPCVYAAAEKCSKNFFSKKQEIMTLQCRVSPCRNSAVFRAVHRERREAAESAKPRLGAGCH